MTKFAVLAGMVLVVLLTATTAALLIPAHRTASTKHEPAAARMLDMHMQMGTTATAPAPAPAAPAATGVGAPLALTSYAGVTGENPDALAAAHPARDATLPAL